MFKKITALALTIALAVAGFTGCGKNYDSVVTIDGVSITAGEYLNAQLQAYTKASQKVESGKDVLKEKIDEINGEEWIHQETIKNLKAYVWAEKKYEEMGLTLSQEITDYANQSAEMYWEYLKEKYTENGVGLETYKKFVVNNIKAGEIFNTVYGENGEKAPSNEEYAEYINTNFAKVKGFSVPKKGKDNKFLDEENLIKMSNICDEAIERLNNGEDFETVRIDIMTKAGELAGVEKDYSDATSNTQEFYVPKNSEQLPQLFVANVYTLEENGEYLYDEIEDEFMIYQRVTNYTSDEEFENLKMGVLNDMKGEEFTKSIEEESASYEISEDSAAVKYYSPSKIK